MGEPNKVKVNPIDLEGTLRGLAEEIVKSEEQSKTPEQADRALTFLAYKARRVLSQLGVEIS